MPDEKIQIKRYPNRRFYSRETSKYVSLAEIEELIRNGQSVEIHDSQTGEDLTRAVLAQIILERQPEKMALFPTDMLHFILQSNDLMSDFLRDYFRHSLTYLDYLRRHTPAATSLQRPMHWVRAWLDGMAPKSAATSSEPPQAQPAPPQASPSDNMAQRIAELEERLRQLEAQRPENQ